MTRPRITWHLLAVFMMLSLYPLSASGIEWKGQDWNVNLNGAFRVSYNSDDIGTEGRANSTPDKTSNNYLSGNVSHIQLTGRRTLSMGFEGIFKTEWGLDPTDTGDGNSFRDLEQYLGLDSRFGTLRAGTIVTPYMQTGITMDPFQRDALAARFFPEIQSGLHSQTGKGRGRSTNTIRFDSPVSSRGIAAQIFYGLDETPDNDNSFGTGLSYNSRYLSLFAQWYDNGEPGKDEAYKIGGEIKAGDVSLFGQYEFDEGLVSLADNLSPLDTSEEDITAEDNDTHGADTWHAGLKYANDKVVLITQYGQRQDSKNGLNQEDGLTGWLVGLGIYVDKYVYLYTGYARKDYNDTSDDDSRFTVGAALRF
ncbi:MAG: porin [Deltaproteobacteria bacterium]|jgi:predicted porin|nr:porin [Deltaproteobacteria bacterium]